MSAKKRLLFVSHEISPYLELTEFAELVNALIVKSNSTGFEVRCIMPRFKSINERRYRLHGVLRLTGININIDNEEYPLQIKVASFNNARVQVYFLENEDLFNDHVFYDNNNKWQETNGLQAIYFCRGVIETIKKFSWPPDIIHISGWMSSFLPFLIKNNFKKEPIFSHNHIVYTACRRFFKEKFEANALKILKKDLELSDKDLDIFKERTHDSLVMAGIKYADSVTVEHGIEKRILDEIKTIKKKKFFYHQPNQEVMDIINFYNLITKTK